MNRWEELLDEAVAYIAGVRQWEAQDATGQITRLIDESLIMIGAHHLEEGITLDDEEQAWTFINTVSSANHWAIEVVKSYKLSDTPRQHEILMWIFTPLNFLASEAIVHWSTEGIAQDVTPEGLAKTWRLYPLEPLPDTSDEDGYCE